MHSSDGDGCGEGGGNDVDRGRGDGETTAAEAAAAGERAGVTAASAAAGTPGVVSAWADLNDSEEGPATTSLCVGADPAAFELWCRFERGGGASIDVAAVALREGSGSFGAGAWGFALHLPGWL